MSWMTFLFLPLLFLGLDATGATYYADPEKGRAENPGTAEAPWRTLEEVLEKPGALKPGDALRLRNGYHGEIKRALANNAEVVTIEAQEGHEPKLGGLHVDSGSKWTFRGLTISSSFAKNPVDGPQGSLVMLGDRGESRDLVIENSFVYTELDSSKWTAEDWMKKARSGIWLGRDGANLTARNNYVLNTRFAINLCGPDSLCEANTIENFSGDGIRVTRDGLTVQYNTVKNAYVSGADGDKNHDDLIQCFLFNKGTGTMRKATVRGNILIGREDPAQPHPNMPQAIGFFDGPLIEFLVEKNVILTAHWHGVALYDAQNCQILDNVCQTHWPEAKPKPWVMLGSKQGLSKGNTVKNNYAVTFDFKADPEAKLDNNLPVTEEIYQQRLVELATFINEKFGAVHPVAKLPRLRAGSLPASAALVATPAPAPDKNSGASAAPKAAPEDLAPHRRAAIERMAAVGAARTASVYLKVMGSSQSVTVREPGKESFQIELAGNRLPVKWSQLEDLEIAQMARALAGDDAEALYQAAFIARSLCAEELFGKLSDRLAEVDATRAAAFSRESAGKAPPPSASPAAGK